MESSIKKVVIQESNPSEDNKAIEEEKESGKLPKNDNLISSSLQSQGTLGLEKLNLEEKKATELVKGPKQTIKITEWKKAKLYFSFCNSKEIWDDIIKVNLERIKKGINSFEDLAECIRIFTKLSGCKNPHNLSSLRSLYKSKTEQAFFFSELLPFIAEQALLIPNYFPDLKIPVIAPNQELVITIPREIVPSLIACSFFCFLPEKQENISMSRYNMCSLHDCKHSNLMKIKLKFYLEYFASVKSIPPVGQILIGRATSTCEGFDEIFKKSKKKLVSVETKEKGVIEDDDSRAVLIDFANRFIGGGFITRGSVQEEIMFLEYPELLVSRLVNDIMESKDAIIIRGVEKYSKYKGYGESLSYDGKYTEHLKAISGVIMRDIVAIDAIKFEGKEISKQFNFLFFFREMKKAWVGFAADKLLDPSSQRLISTGRWGCGAFNGNSQLKFLIQWLVASEQERPLIFYQRQDLLLKTLPSFIEKMKNRTVSELCTLLCLILPTFAKNENHEELFEILAKL